jgi:low temperature requirement protein LtrA
VIETIRQFKDWFWKPPRAHGDVLEDRSVSPLELLYDLIYVAVIAQVARRLATDVSVIGVAEFVIVFTLVWIAWVNGSLYLELHGRDDGRTRSFVFIQMAILAFIAVFASTAADTGGAPFAVTYTAFLIVLALMWNSVRGQDTPEAARVTKGYTLLLVASAAAILVSAFVAPDIRLIVWGAFCVAWLGAMAALGMRSRSFSIGVTPTKSMIERFGTFVIIVLGEFVVDVVDGLSHGELDVLTIWTGVNALGLGLGFWWIYFDLVGGRPPRNTGRALTTWILGHWPITLAIAGSGAAMVSLIEHAHDPSGPAATAWLLGGAIALALVAHAFVGRQLAVRDRLAVVYRPMEVALLAAAALVLVLGWAHPTPWIQIVGSGLTLLALWFLLVVRLIGARAWPPAA